MIPSSTWRRQLQQIDIKWCHNAIPSPTSPKPLPPWPVSSSKQLQHTTEGPGCRWIGRANQIPSGWTVWTKATTVKRVWERDRDIGRTLQDLTTWEETRTASRGHEENREAREIFSNTKMNISHNLRVRNLYPIADSGATLNCLCINSARDYDKLIEPIWALLPDGNKINAHIQCKIKMDGLPEQSKIAYKFNGTQEPLMSIPVLCENR